MRRVISVDPSMENTLLGKYLMAYAERKHFALVETAMDADTLTPCACNEHTKKDWRNSEALETTLESDRYLMKLLQLVRRMC